jgi:hypothetical protein
MATTNFVIKNDFKHASIRTAPNFPGTAIVSAKTSYIPIEEFKKIFESIGTLVKKEGIKKLIFDKQNLTVFHQPSMEWYFTEWKEEMFDMGLKVHRKILPDNEVFQQSVRIGREKINKAYPNGKFHQMDIRYAKTLEEALEK